jgi:hypothetical protein
MKTLITILFAITIFTTSNAQNQVIETQSVALDDFITFIAENYPMPAENNNNLSRNITFLIQTKRKNLSNETAIILKQAFKFLSKRLNEDDQISIVAYSGINGLVLDKTSPDDIKKIFFVLNDFKSNVNKIKSDGIAFAYEYANNSYEEDMLNSVVMIRNPHPTNSVIASSITPEEVNDTVAPQKNNSILLLTAITLLPELISIIKD